MTRADIAQTELARDLQARRQLLIDRLGGHAPTQFRLRGRQPLETKLTHTRVERLDLAGASGTPVRAILTGPSTPWTHLPAILYCHAHGNRTDIGANELIAGRPALIAPPYGEALAHAGIVALCIDLPCFGGRSGDSEQALAKRYLWHGETLFGAMLDDLAGALNVLTALEGVDPGRVGVLGLSMGATLAFWLAALETRIKAAAHLCCFADLATLVASGAHDLHGPYMTVPGLLATARTGQIAGLIAPRPQLACMGFFDPLTPKPAIEQALADTRLDYTTCNAASAFETCLSAGTGHVETPAMRAAVLDFFGRRL